MKNRLFHSAVVVVALALSGPSLAGKGGGGTGGSGYQRGYDKAPGQDVSTQRHSDMALQRDRDREQYRGPDAERDTKKANSKGQGTGMDRNDQLRTRDQDRLREQRMDN